MKEKKFNYVVPKVRVVQVKTRNCLLTMSENTRNAKGMIEGSFGARGSRFSDWNDFDEE